VDASDHGAADRITPSLPATIAGSSRDRYHAVRPQARKESHVKAPQSAGNPLDFPDPLDESDERSLTVSSEDLLSQLADDAVDRMLSSDSLEPITDERAAPAPVLNPVQELTSQLDTFFEELRQRQEEAAAVVDAIPEANPLEIDEQERAALDSPVEDTSSPPDPATPKDLIAQYESKKPTPWLMRPFDRGAAAMEAMSPLLRGIINVSVVASFLAACAALVWVLILRQG
jgi:hypothetical protein